MSDGIKIVFGIIAKFRETPKDTSPSIQPNDDFYKKKIQTHQKESSIETTIVGGVTAGLLLRLILWLL